MTLSKPLKFLNSRVHQSCRLLSKCFICLQHLKAKTNNNFFNIIHITIKIEWFDNFIKKICNRVLILMLALIILHLKILK